MIGVHNLVGYTPAFEIPSREKSHFTMKLLIGRLFVAYDKTAWLFAKRPSFGCIIIFDIETEL